MQQAKQQELFTIPEVKYCCGLDPDQFESLQDLALLATEKPLMFGEPKSNSAEDRLELILKHLPGQETYAYFIMSGNMVIGFFHIWDGWIAIEMDYVTPEVEVAFLHPDFDNYKPMIEKQIYAFLAQIQEDNKHEM